MSTFTHSVATALDIPLSGSASLTQCTLQSTVLRYGSSALVCDVMSAGTKMARSISLTILMNDVSAQVFATDLMLDRWVGFCVRVCA
jgi:hypothetical protein